MSSIVYGPKLGMLYNAPLGVYYGDGLRSFLQSIDAIVQCSVVNATTVVPPSTPNPGDAYLLGLAPSGAWTGHASQIAVWDAQFTLSGVNTVVPQWIFLTPKAGWILWNVALGALYVYNGAQWNPLTAGINEPVDSYADQIGSGTVAGTANTAIAWALNFAEQHTFDNLGISVATADDSSNNYSFGIYSASGTLLASTGVVPGTTLTPSTGYQTVTLTGQTVFPAGTYFLVLTTDAGTAAFHTVPNGFSNVNAVSSGATTGGALSSTIPVPAQTPQASNTRPAVFLF